MPQFCDVALAVPLDANFTYRIGEGQSPVVGGRVLVPFREKKLSGIVVRLHDEEPKYKLKQITSVLDAEPVLDAHLLALGEWIASYYIAPLGEVYRTMLPLGAEFRHATGYRITERGSEALYESATVGSSRRSRVEPEQQMAEYAVLDYLAEGELVREETIRSATGATRQMLRSLVAKKWIEREDLSSVRDARRVVKVAVLVEELQVPPLGLTPSVGMTAGVEKPSGGTTAEKLQVPPLGLTSSVGMTADVGRPSVGMTADVGRPSVGMTADVGGPSVGMTADISMPSVGMTAGVEEPPVGKTSQEGKAIKLNANQRAIVEFLKGRSGRAAVDDVRGLDVPKSTLQTLVKRGLVRIEEEAAELSRSGMQPRSTLGFLFTSAQQEALKKILESVAERKLSVSLLHGVTGSGKTAVYLAAMQSVLNEGRGAILLVPEIGLTPAVSADLHSIFGDQVAILHSSLSNDERAEQWHRIRRGEARVVVGTRSAIFAPVRDLALIIVDEEHDHSYKQEETPRYHARDVAAVRAKRLGATVVLGSATPSLESYNNTNKGKYRLIELPDRVQDRPLPEVELIDMREEFQQTGHEQVLSRKLIEEVTARLERGEQAMILLNRRGYSAFVMCRACGDSIECQNCAIALTHHKREHKLMCHYCGYQQAIPKVCPKCGSDYVQFLGTGSEKLEDMMHKAFPMARIGRMDRDTVRGHDDFERILTAFQAGEIDLLVGTQMIAKGHDMHGVTLVGVVGADTALSLPDFRAAERTFQLLTQVAGRAGRGTTPGKVVLQTYFPDHYAVQYAAAHDFAGFYDKELRFRGWMHYPPFTALANVLVRSDKLEEAMHYSGVLGRWFEGQSKQDIRVLGPAAAPIVRLKRDYRYHFLLKSGSREKLNALLRSMMQHAVTMKVPRTSVIIDMDAISLM